MADSDYAAEPPAAPPRAKPAADPIDTRLVRRLADILKDTDLTEIEVERGDLKIRVARSVQVAAPMMAAAPMAMAVQAAAAPPAGAAAVTTNDTGPAPRGDAVKSPMVGTAYLQAQPGSPSFIRVGDKVNEGQTLLIIEAMKTMNPIPAPRAGTIVEILVQDAQPVEYGEPLVVIE